MAQIQISSEDVMAYSKQVDAYANEIKTVFNEIESKPKTKVSGVIVELNGSIFITPDTVFNVHLAAWAINCKQFKWVDTGKGAFVNMFFNESSTT